MFKKSQKGTGALLDTRPQKKKLLIKKNWLIFLK